MLQNLYEDFYSGEDVDEQHEMLADEFLDNKGSAGVHASDDSEEGRKLELGESFEEGDIF